MSATVISKQEYPSQQYIEFSVAFAMEGKNPELNTIYKSLAPVCELSGGKVYKRSDNGDLWHIDPDNKIARIISEERLQLLHKWDTKQLLPVPELLETLKTIGGLPSQDYSLLPDSISFPCKIKTVEGDSVDLCVLFFSAAPPLSYWIKKTLLLDEIVDIEPSELSLSHDLRLESMLAEEIKMSFYPFMVKHKNGELILYNGTTLFASADLIKGNEIIGSVPFSDDTTYKFVEVPINEITYVIGKWDDRLQSLFEDYRRQLRQKKASNSNPVENSVTKPYRNIRAINRVWKWLRGK